jgi:hypothetical protein
VAGNGIRPHKIWPEGLLNPQVTMVKFYDFISKIHEKNQKKKHTPPKKTALGVPDLK